MRLQSVSNRGRIPVLNTTRGLTVVLRPLALGETGKEPSLMTTENVGTTVVGLENKNGQIVVRNTGRGMAWSFRL